MSDGDNYVAKRVFNRVLSVVLLVSFYLVSSSAVFGQAAGFLDRTFNGTGKTLVSFDPQDTPTSSATAIQSDGKIITGGRVVRPNDNYDFALVRFNADGSLDNTFGDNGRVYTDVTPRDVVLELAIQPDGKILAVGSYYPPVIVLRYNTNGTLDTTFANGGILITPLGSIGFLKNIFVFPDGKIMVASGSTVARYLTNGVPDRSFDRDGFLNISGDPIQSFAVQRDGKIILTGNSSYTNSTVTRLNSDGTFDPTFGVGGVVNTSYAPNFNAWRGIAIQADGKVVCMSGTSGYVVIRLNEDGTPDTAFGNNGVAYTAIRGSEDQPNSLMLQPDGKIIVAGYSYHYLTPNSLKVGLSAARYLPYGTLDRTFGLGGISFIELFPFSYMESAAMQKDGKIVSSGYQGSGGLVVARTNADPVKTFSNANQINIADFNNGTPGTGSLYPSIINVHGLKGFPTNIRVTLKNVNHPRLSDLDILLVAASGQRIILTSDSTSQNPLGPASDLRFDQRSTRLMPASSPYFSEELYRPNNFDGNDGAQDNFPAPGPGSAIYGNSDLATLANADPNGDWRLFVVDDEAGNIGSIAGWELEIATSAPQRAQNDFDGDGKTDIALYRPSLGVWYVLRSASGFNSYAFGQTGGLPLSGDYDRDGLADLTTFQSGAWKTLLSETQVMRNTKFGLTSDIPLSADFDGDGSADQVIFRPSNQVWYVNRSRDGILIFPFGAPEDIPQIGDFDGDGRPDPALFRPSLGQWWILQSSAGARVYRFGLSGDIPIVADYTGDGKTDVAVWRPSDGTWYVSGDAMLDYTAVAFGTKGDIPVTGDYDGDGKNDLTVFRPSVGLWFTFRSSDLQVEITRFGSHGDIPPPQASYLP